MQHMIISPAGIVRHQFMDASLVKLLIPKQSEGTPYMIRKLTKLKDHETLNVYCIRLGQI